jgi:hypothetical protein
LQRCRHAAVAACRVQSSRLRGPRAISSAGRAPPRQGGGHWFEPSIAHRRNPVNCRVSVFTDHRDHPFKHLLCLTQSTQEPIPEDERCQRCLGVGYHPQMAVPPPPSVRQRPGLGAEDARSGALRGVAGAIRAPWTATVQRGSAPQWLPPAVLGRPGAGKRVMQRRSPHRYRRVADGARGKGGGASLDPGPADVPPRQVGLLHGVTGRKGAPATLVKGVCVRGRGSGEHFFGGASQTRPPARLRGERSAGV